MPWRVTGIMTSTSARAISVRSVALSMRRNAGLWVTPGFTTILRRTPKKSRKKTFILRINRSEIYLLFSKKYGLPSSSSLASGLCTNSGSDG